MVYNVTKAPIGWSLFRDRDRIAAYASREAALEVATAAGADAGIVTACKSTVLNEIEKSVSWPDRWKFEVR